MLAHIVITDALFFGVLVNAVAQIVRWLGLQVAMVYVQYFIKPAGDVETQGIHIQRFVLAVLAIVQPAFVREGVNSSLLR
jgi:hypothetical protein